ncbi:putative bifunctional diguanylate cyclase/phosphodiesterase [Candidatus Stoquefichus sp. SB1]|uniref:putative bifunctional diguanylate cyclase/phosphodiesterase n=1 Tax=Candidatus Stoquefichus sp. SB1 TaxID=1658109 RepID=UPI00067E87A3|nr:bifunctional diguanylate cyclase/phosphodiesterase [Candidatus Stoquefichus sp. SB1]
MSWNIVPECVSIIILMIIWIYSRKGSALPTLKNQLFQSCFLITFCAMATNILSTVMIQYLHLFPIWLTELITTLYFICTPLMGMIYFLYSASIIYDNDYLFKVMLMGSIPGIGYVILVCLNPVLHLLFQLDSINGYTRGSLIAVTYIIFYIYCIASVIIVMINKKKVDYQIYKILTTFPIIAVIVIIIQQIYPTIILSGTAATMALLIIYLHLQNKQLTIDSITNLPNRSELFSMMEILIHKNNQAPFILMVISLRDFKRINEIYGQLKGNEFLKIISQFLCTITSRNHVYRFNGDEFAILIPGDSQEEVKSITHKLTERMNHSWQLHDYRIHISTVIGIASYPSSAITAEKLITAVEYAVIQAKHDPHKDIYYCDLEMMNSISRRDEIIQILKDKIADKSFELYYQPIINMETGKFQYAESLLRIPDSPLGPLYPDEFIPIAEETGLIIEMTYQIIDKVCQFIQLLINDNIEMTSIHINFSASQFNEDNLVEKVINIIEKNQIPFSKIKIEFTETTIAKNVQLVTDFTNTLAQKGIRMGLDDFGTGYSNIASVLDIPFGTIKLDKSLIWSAIEHPRSAIIVKNLTRAFQDLGLSVVAEGVENEEHVQLIKDCHIDYVQGFYYARPMDKEQTIKFLKEKCISN